MSADRRFSANTMGAPLQSFYPPSMYGLPASMYPFQQPGAFPGAYPGSGGAGGGAAGSTGAAGSAAGGNFFGEMLPWSSTIFTFREAPPRWQCWKKNLNACRSSRDVEGRRCRFSKRLADSTVDTAKRRMRSLTAISICSCRTFFSRAGHSERGLVR